MPDGSSPEDRLSTTPHPRLRLHPRFHSRFLPDDRDVMVYLPPEYAADTRKRFPVFYMHDGQNLFDPRKSFIPGRTWQVRETADSMILVEDVEPLIIVGIHNTGERRLAEYTPTRDWKMGGGEANSYGKLLTGELMPFINSEYRTLQGPEHTGMGGSSLGGLVTLYLGLKYSTTFGKLAVMSPSVWWDHKSILGYLNEFEGPPWPRTWLDVGDSEGPKALGDVNLLYRRLLAKGWREAETLHCERVKGGTHDEAAWARRMGPMLRFLFPSKS